MNTLIPVPQHLGECSLTAVNVHSGFVNVVLSYGDKGSDKGRRNSECVLGIGLRHDFPYIVAGLVMVPTW